MKSLICVRLLATPGTAAYQAPPSMDFPGKSTGVGCHCLLRKKFYIKIKRNIFFNILVFNVEKAMAPYSSTLSWKIHGRRSLVGCSPWRCKESDMTELLHFHFSLSCLGEGNGNPLQYSCLENPRDRGAWWAAVYGVAQSWTRLKQLSSSSSL